MIPIQTTFRRTRTVGRLLVLLMVGCGTLNAQFYAEYFLDVVGAYGTGTPIGLSAIGNDAHTGDADVDISGLEPGLHTLFIRSYDSAANRWSQIVIRPFLVERTQANPIVYGEYYFNDDPGYGAATPLPVGNGVEQTLDYELSTADLDEGLNKVCLRFRDAHGLWTATTCYSLLVRHQVTRIVVAGEYFFDNELLPHGSGYEIEVANPSEVTMVDLALDIPEDALATLDGGNHTIFYRFRDQTGRWSHTERTGICLNLPGGEYEAQTSPGDCAETLTYEFVGTPAPGLTYELDLDGDGTYETTATDGDSFTFEPAPGVTEIAYRLSTNFCPLPSEGTIEVESANGAITTSTVTGNDCPGDCAGSIVLTTTGQSSSYNYVWSDGTIGSMRENLCGGEYDVTITDAEDCESYASITVDEPNALEISVETTAADPGQTNGGATVMIQGGTAGYSCAWLQNGATITNECSPQNLAAGDYQLKITDANGCEETVSVSIPSTVSSKEVLSEAAWEVHPIPTTGPVTLQFELPAATDLTLTLTDGLGRQLQIQRLDDLHHGTVQLDLSDLPSGLYWLHAEGDRVTGVRRVSVLR